MGNNLKTQKPVSNKKALVKQTGFLLPADLYQRLRVCAAENGVTMSAIAEQAIRNHLSKEAKRAA